MSSSTTIGEKMSPWPHTITPDTTIDRAQRIMGEERIRHLPVVVDHRLVGIVSERDLRLGYTLEDGLDSTVEMVMAKDPYMAHPDTPIAEVAQEMVKRKLGCALVGQDGKVAGIFTVHDGLKILVEVLS